jgi:hypothetical protein
MNKKISLCMLAAAMALTMGGSALADAPIAELKVIGSLDVPGCTVTADNNGTYDFGSISPTTIKSGTTAVALTAKSQQWAINCSGTTYLTFKVIDNQAASVSAAGGGNFGLGNVNGTGKLGYYTVAMSNPTVDGVASSVFSTNTTTIAGAATASVYSGAYTMGWSTASALKAGQDFGVTLAVTPRLAGTTTMNGPITSDTDLNGSLTLNFAFGL